MVTQAKGLTLNFFSVKKFFLALLLCTFFYQGTSYLVEFYNPDWIIYQLIFDDGSHLKENGRDLGFLAIIDFFKIFSNNYEAFRYFLAICFCSYIFFLGNGNILKYTFKKNKIIVSFFFLISFLFIRFTIQIREGVAICLVISALANMLNDDVLKTNKPIPFWKTNNFNILIKFLIAITIHSGVAIFFLIFIISYFVKNNFQFFRPIYKVYGKTIFYSSLLLAVGIAFLYNGLIGKVYFLQEEEQLVSTEVNSGKIFYWLINGILTTILIFQLKKYAISLINKQTKIYLLLISNFLLPFIFVITFTSIILSSPGGLVSALGRIYNLALGISLLVLCYKTKGNSLFILLLSLFIIIDQARIVIESLIMQEFI